MAENSVSAGMSDKFSVKAFIHGLGAVIILLLLFAIWIQMNKDKAASLIEQRLASQTVIIEWLDEAAKIAGSPSDTHSDEHGVETEEHAEHQDKVEEIDYSDPVTMESGLTAAPIGGLTESGVFGPVPVIRTKDGMTAFKAYRRPYDVQAATRPIIALAITDLGLSDIATESAVRTMPPQISFIMSPYAETVDFWTNESRARGHEVWLTLPMESQSYPLQDPGPHTMLVGAPERENHLKMQWLLSRVEGYVGFVTSYRPTFMQSPNDMRPVIGQVYSAGLAFVDGSLDPALVPQTMAMGMKAPYSTIDIWVDKPDASQESIKLQLRELEKLAHDKGFAVGIIHPLPVSFQQVQEWVKTLPKKGFELVPLSATTGY